MMRPLALLLLSCSLAFGQAFTFADPAFMSGLNAPDATNFSRSLWVSNTELPFAVLFMDADNTTTNYLGTNEAVSYGTLAYAAGVVDNAFDFSSNDSWLVLPNYPGLQYISQKFTAEWWAKNKGNAVSDWCMLTRDGDGILGYILGRSQGGTNVTAVISTGGSAWVTLPGGDPVDSMAGWTHFALTYAYNVSGESIVQTYTNGFLNTEYNFGSLQLLSANTADLFISAYNADNYHFDGLIDEIAFYATNLTADQIFKIYQAGTNGSSKRFSSY